MSRYLGLVIAGVLGCSSPVIAAGGSAEHPSHALRHLRSIHPGAGPLAQAAAREMASLSPAARTVASVASGQLPRQERGWVERHPVWTATLVGAGVGAGWGALACSDGCFPIGAGGAAIVGGGYGAGVGALVGVAIGAAR